MPDPSPAPGSVLARSARGATYLILVQLTSRALTFVVNQVLLRYLSPELLGISNQLDLYGVSALYFARESLRVALQRANPSDAGRQTDGRGPASGPDGNVLDDHGTSPGASEQAAVNLSYVAIALGGPLLAFFAWLYLRSADEAALAVPFLHESLFLYAVACLIELLSEPAFAAAQQQLLYHVRARAETGATLARCFVVCGVSIWGSRHGLNLGALPFACGQLSFALALSVIYYVSLWNHHPSFSLSPRPLHSRTTYDEYLPSAATTVALNFYAQAGLKHILSQGDALLTTLFASLASQGIYALASSYGSLLARLVFQPIEESSRGVFGRLLGARPRPPDRAAARSYLTTLLRVYALLALPVVALGPVVAPLLLRLVAGRRWAASDAPRVLGLYCYYLPLLACNGVLEAFVAAVARPDQIRRQSAWMLAFAAGFAGAGYLFLRVYDLGAAGLIAANAVNMAARIVWSGAFVRRSLGPGGLDYAQIVPRLEVVGISVLVWAMLHQLSKGFEGRIQDLAVALAISAVYALLSLFLEREFIFGLRALFQSRAKPVRETGSEKSGQEKKAAGRN